jgi:hypothetical protein
MPLNAGLEHVAPLNFANPVALNLNDWFAGDTIVSSARERILLHSQAYAFGSAPTSPHPALSGNRQPGISPLSWLKNQNKCNQFVGDVLTAAGFSMPVYRMGDGSLHYKLAEDLPRESRYFRKITQWSEVIPGDVLVFDYPARGSGGAHVEIITALNKATGNLLSAGAHHNGAYETLRYGLSTALINGTRDGSTIHILRPALRGIER